MDQKDISLAVKIFNHFFKKAKITKIKIYSRNIVYENFPEGAFGLDIYYGTYNKCWHSLIDDNLDLFNFIAPAKYAYLVNIYHFKSISLDEMPNSLKEAVINGCIASRKGIMIYDYNIKLPQYKDFIPKASSLEELAIKTELES